MAAEHCIIVPVHPPKSNWLVALLTSLRASRPAAGAAPASNPFRIILALSSFGDLLFFERLLNALGLASGVDLFCADSYILDRLRSPALLQRLQKNSDGCVVNLKKLLALQWAAAEGFGWAICIDTDTTVIGDVTDLFPTQIANYGKRSYFGASGQTGLFQRINAAVVGAFPDQDREILGGKLKDLSWYMWFFDMPLYDLADFKTFLHHMSGPLGSVEAWLASLTHSTFEHLLFSYWRMVHAGCRAVDYRDIGIDRLPENLTAHDLIRIDAAYNYHPSWINTVQFFLEPGIKRIMPSLTLAYHFDRMHATGG